MEWDTDDTSTHMGCGEAREDWRELGCEPLSIVRGCVCVHVCVCVCVHVCVCTHMCVCVCECVGHNTEMRKACTIIIFYMLYKCTTHYIVYMLRTTSCTHTTIVRASINFQKFIHITFEVLTD